MNLVIVLLIVAIVVAITCIDLNTSHPVFLWAWQGPTCRQSTLKHRFKCKPIKNTTQILALFTREMWWKTYNWKKKWIDIYWLYVKQENYNLCVCLYVRVCDWEYVCVCMSVSVCVCVCVSIPMYYWIHKVNAGVLSFVRWSKRKWSCVRRPGQYWVRSDVIRYKCWLF